MRAALAALAAGPLVRHAAVFVPTTESTAADRSPIPHQTVAALAARHAAKIKRRRRGHAFAELTERGRAHLAQLARQAADDNQVPS